MSCLYTPAYNDIRDSWSRRILNLRYDNTRGCGKRINNMHERSRKQNKKKEVTKTEEAQVAKHRDV